MAMKELELKQQGVKFINIELRQRGIKFIDIELHKQFPHRILAAIRGHACRRQIEYKTILQQCTSSSSENIQTPLVGWQSQPLDCLETIEENNSRCFNELWKRMSKDEVGLNDQERKRINIALSGHFPDMSVK